MKKLAIILSLIISCMCTTGCQSKTNIKTFMLTRDDTIYALYNQEGEQITNFLYKSYVKVGNNGYIVTDNDGQVGYINNKGKEIIPFGEYETLELTDEMLYGTKKVKAVKSTTKKTTKKSTKKTKKKTEKKTTEEDTSPKYISSNLYILNLDGEVLYSASKDTTILKADLPVIYDVKDETYTILHDSGDIVDESGDQVQSVSMYDNGDGVLVNYPTISMFYDFYDEDQEAIAITTAGDYKMLALDELNDESAVAYDANSKNLVFLNIKTEHASVIPAATIEGAYYDDENNLICYNGETKYFVDGNGTKLITSYYHSKDTYIERSDDVYGPHTLYNEGEKTEELDHCQVFPRAYFVEGSLFPVYIRNKGYQYYDFNGKLAFDYTYTEAIPFDLNGIGIVKNNDTYYLINKTGKQITTNEYTNIESIGKSYYIGYNDQGAFAVIDNTGKEVLPMGYTLLASSPVFYKDGIKYLLLNKNGRSYLYDADNDMKELFSIEGNLEYNDVGYFQDGYHYYTFEGEEIE